MQSEDARNRGLDALTEPDEPVPSRLGSSSDNGDEESDAATAYRRMLAEFGLTPTAAPGNLEDKAGDEEGLPMPEPSAHGSTVLRRNPPNSGSDRTGHADEPIERATSDDAPPATVENAALDEEELRKLALEWLSEQFKDPHMAAALLEVVRTEAGGAQKGNAHSRLNDEQRRALELLKPTLRRADWRQLVAELRPTGDSPPAGTQAAREPEPEPNAPVRISKARLTRQVGGFGIYEALPHTRFTAGRSHSLVTYLELDRFETVRRGELHVVNLLQEIELYSQSAGHEPIWRTESARLVDESRNRRRDFFTVQVVRLPSLAVGHYVLKIRITDQANQTTDVASIPITIIERDRS
ncbi:MAG: hypothetical protein JJU36_03010 [Phycisphaeraceae bacterium]|nr:hypothetical protein [Phycisphaeraceae bacterium]